MTMYKLISQNNSTSQRYILTGLLAFALIATAMPALAKDHHDNKHKVFYSHNDKHDYDKHYYKHKRVHQSHGKKHHKKNYYNNHHNTKHYYQHRGTHYRRHNNHSYSHDYGHSYDRYYYKQRRHYKHRHHYKHGHSSYIDDYFAILGGTILVNELLYHSHEHR